jgi:hypothetical protein
LIKRAAHRPRRKEVPAPIPFSGKDLGAVLPWPAMAQPQHTLESDIGNLRKQFQLK